MAETILVTGGAGYIGSHIVAELAAAGYAPMIVDSFATSSPTVLPRLRHLTAPGGALRDGRRPRSRADDATVCRARGLGGHSLRGTESRRRKRAAADRVLRQQCRRRDRARRSDGGSGREDARIQLIGHGLRTTGPQSGRRGRAVAQRERLRPHQADRRADFRRRGVGRCAMARRTSSLLQSRRRSSLGRDRRGAVRGTQQSGADTCASRGARIERRFRSSATIGIRRTGPESGITCT